ncbi:hypothetical protein KY333_04370 [Candidatus Woesearchaeota archaeon]|nr:hypothetical protein [Candidatus Woesearchaeota archaeon]
MNKKIGTKFALALGLGILALVLGVGMLFFKIEGSPWSGMSVIILGMIFTILAIFLYKRQGKKHEIDYRTLFTMGLIFFAIGMSTNNPGMWGLGLIFFAVGLVNRKKWKKQRTWSEMSKSEKNIKIAILIALGVLVFVGFMFFLLAM